MPRLTPWMLAVLLLLSSTARAAENEPPLDPVRGRALMQKFQRSETLTAEEQAYLDRVREDIRRRRGQGGQKPTRLEPAQSSEATTGQWPPSYGAPMEEIEKNPAQYGYSSGITEAAQVRCPILILFFQKVL